MWIPQILGFPMGSDRFRMILGHLHFKRLCYAGFPSHGITSKSSIGLGLSIQNYLVSGLPMNHQYFQINHHSCQLFSTCKAPAWWFQPLLNNISQLGLLFPIYGAKPPTKQHLITIDPHKKASPMYVSYQVTPRQSPWHALVGSHRGRPGFTRVLTCVLP